MSNSSANYKTVTKSLLQELQKLDVKEEILRKAFKTLEDLEYQELKQDFVTLKEEFATLKEEFRKIKESYNKDKLKKVCIPSNYL